MSLCRRTLCPVGNEGVKASRDGDRFHHYWAARRALLLLDPLGDLKKLTIEGLGDATSDEVGDAHDVQGAGLRAATLARICSRGQSIRRVTAPTKTQCPAALRPRRRDPNINLVYE